MRKYKLKCFICKGLFKSNKEVFKDSNKFPICEICFIEFLEETWDPIFAEYILKQIKKNFNRNYLKWEKWFYKNHILCDGEHNDYDFFYEEKNSITVVNGKNYCRQCIEVRNNIHNIIRGLKK